LSLGGSFFYFLKRFIKKIKSGAYSEDRKNRIKHDKQEKNHVKFCDMDVAGTKHTRFGLPYKLLHQNEIVPFFMDEKRNV
jgi:hypothetical protein